MDTVAIRPFPFRDVQDWRVRSPSFEEIAGFAGRSLALSESEEPERFNGTTIPANLFPLCTD